MLFERAISKRKAERAKVTDWAAWTTTLQDLDKTLIPEAIGKTPSDGGQRMIIGYNDKTGEIAISDSWSSAFAIRWMTLAEANAINAGQSYVIEPQNSVVARDRRASWARPLPGGQRLPAKSLKPTVHRPPLRLGGILMVTCFASPWPSERTVIG